MHALGVVEDFGDVQTDVTLLQKEPSEVREAIGEVLKVQTQGSPLWTSYASYEMSLGNWKVCWPIW